jgi:hypothetical protein
VLVKITLPAIEKPDFVGSRQFSYQPEGQREAAVQVALTDTSVQLELPEGTQVVFRLRDISTKGNASEPSELTFNVPLVTPPRPGPLAADLAV